MSKKDYTKFTKPPEDETKEVTAVAEDEVETQGFKFGIVTGCARLNVRQNGDVNSDVLCAIDEGYEVEIYESASNSDFYKICTAAGVEGFCMKQYITIKP